MSASYCSGHRRAKASTSPSSSTTTPPGRSMHYAHSGRRIVQASHAVDPGVHVATVETGKAKDFCKDIVKRRPVDDWSSVELDDHLHIVIQLSLADSDYCRSLDPSEVCTAGQFTTRPGPAPTGGDVLRGCGARHFGRGYSTGVPIVKPPDGDALCGCGKDRRIRAIAKPRVRECLWRNSSYCHECRPWTAPQNTSRCNP